MPRKKPGTSKHQPAFSQPGILLEEVMAPHDEKPPQLDPNTRKKTNFQQTLDKMDPNDLRKRLDDFMAESLEPAEPVDPAIFKRVARKTRQWEQPFNVPDIPGYKTPKESGGRKIKRFRRSLVQIILDEATEDDASVPTPEVQHYPDPGPSTNPTATERSVFKLNQATVPEEFVEARSSRSRA
ncbi:hypothetical protein FRC00_000813 [Tulasnella sp. 408]|nr:hypothetical protein FRC00_000813 [Tulasnella sp. 408]